MGKFRLNRMGVLKEVASMFFFVNEDLISVEGRKNEQLLLPIPIQIHQNGITGWGCPKAG